MQARLSRHYPGDTSLTCGVYGVHDETSSATGALIPLEGMMALDSLLSLAQGRSTVHHLAGSNMRHYTRDQQVMRPVEEAIGGTLDRLGYAAANLTQVVIDATGIAEAIHPDAPPIVSQYDLIAAYTPVGSAHGTCPKCHGFASLYPLTPTSVPLKAARCPCGNSPGILQPHEKYRMLDKIMKRTNVNSSYWFTDTSRGGLFRMFE